MLELETHLRQKIENGKKLFVGYITGGLIDNWLDYVNAMLAGGVDALEVGIPFSDPMIDGPVIQESSMRALSRGETPLTILDALSRNNDLLSFVDVAVMTYYNIVFRAGKTKFLDLLASVGIKGVIIPDLPLEESTELSKQSSALGIANVLLVAPSTSDVRLKKICDQSEGFVYVISRMHTTGESHGFEDSSIELLKRVAELTDKPKLVGVGISDPAQANQAKQYSDGIIVGSGIVRRILEGQSAQEIENYCKVMNRALLD